LLLLSAVAFCTDKTVLINGRVAPRVPGLSIRAELVYDNDDRGNPTDIEVTGSTFRVRMEYRDFGRSDCEVLIHPFTGGCERKLKQVIVRLMDGNREVDRTTLNVPKDFRSGDRTELIVRSEVVLSWSEASPPK